MNGDQMAEEELSKVSHSFLIHSQLSAKRVLNMNELT